VKITALSNYKPGILNNYIRISHTRLFSHKIYVIAEIDFFVMFENIISKQFKNILYSKYFVQNLPFQKYCQLKAATFILSFILKLIF
jgi:hypothetical protein